jgi:hypothetical protein
MYLSFAKMSSIGGAYVNNKRYFHFYASRENIAPPQVKQGGEIGGEQKRTGRALGRASGIGRPHYASG